MVRVGDGYIEAYKLRNPEWRFMNLSSDQEEDILKREDINDNVFFSYRIWFECIICRHWNAPVYGYKAPRMCSNCRTVNTYLQNKEKWVLNAVKEPKFVPDKDEIAPLRYGHETNKGVFVLDLDPNSKNLTDDDVEKQRGRMSDEELDEIINKEQLPDIE